MTRDGSQVAPPGPTPAQLADRQRTNIRNAIDAADTAVAAVNNKAGPDVVTTADQRIADARAAIDAAQNVLSPERNAFTGNVNVLDSRLSSAKAARTAAMTAAQQAADKAAMEKASKLYPAIQAYNKSGINFRGQSLNENSNAGRIGARPGTAGTDTPVVRVWIRRALTSPVILKEDKEATVPSLHGHRGRKFTAKPDGGGTYESTTYTAFNKPRLGQKFSAQYSANLTNKVLNETTTEGTAARVASPSFDQAAGWKRFELPDNNIAVEITGTYHGVAGTYSCVPGSGNTCAANVFTGGFGLGGVTAANVFSRDNATWTFKPDDPEARVMTRPGTRAYEYGWWLHKSADNTWYAGSFADGNGYTLPAATKGTATYQGGAAGVYALNSSTGGTIDSGRFTARATLQADFNDATLTGTIDEFTGDDGQPRNWTVELKNLAIAGDDDRIGIPDSATEGTRVDDTTVWTIDGSPADVSGNWHGTWMRAYHPNPSGTGQIDPPSGVPDGVAGRFYTEYGNDGKMTGGFGASCTTCPEDN